jgi:hypothetical protein
VVDDESTNLEILDTAGQVTEASSKCRRWREYSFSVVQTFLLIAGIKEKIFVFCTPYLALKGRW